MSTIRNNKEMPIADAELVKFIAKQTWNKEEKRHQEEEIMCGNLCIWNATSLSDGLFSGDWGFRREPVFQRPTDDTRVIRDETMDISGMKLNK